MGSLPDIDTHTRLYAVFGDPVAHSLSPLMHNCAFRQIGYNGVYVAMRICDIAAAVSAVRCLSIRGISVTDIIYNPLRSRLLREAAAAGCQVLNGIPMFVYQGALQFKLWTEQAAPLAAMMQAVQDKLASAVVGNGKRSHSEGKPE